MKTKEIILGIELILVITNMTMITGHKIVVIKYADQEEDDDVG